MNNSLVRGAIFALLLGVNAPALSQGKAESLRPEIAKPLQAAQELLKTRQGKEALAKVNEADAIANKTPYESYVVERMRASAAAVAGDVPASIKAFEAVIESGRMQPAEQLPMIQALAGSYYRQKDFSKTIAWTARYFKEGGTDPQMRLVLIQAYYQNNDFESAAQELLSDIEADEKSGKAPEESRLQLLANSYLKLNDLNRYAFALEKLVTYYPKKEYWANLIAQTQKNPMFADRLALDILRLRLSTGNVEGAEDYMDLAQSALTQGYPAEAKRALDKGYAQGALGTGPNADRHRRMRELVDKQLAEDRKSLSGNEMELAAEAQKDGGLALVNLGFAYVTDGQFDRGLAIMERGIAKGADKAAVPNKKPQDSRLRLGIAYLMAGKKDKANATFKEIGGVHGAADIGRLWAIYSRRS